MDCFYAAIEIRDNPRLMHKPVAVGGRADQRGVLCTCNYVARQYGLHAAMASKTALRLCPDLILLPVDMAKYKAVSTRIQAIFKQYTSLVEPLSLDEAYLDVSQSSHCQGSATWIAEAIRAQIFKEEHLTASAGVAPNKLLAKIASQWRKPNGLFVILPQDVARFMQYLPVDKLFGVGKVTAEKLHRLGVNTCGDLQQFSQIKLAQWFGKMGVLLYQQCRGLDERKVENDRQRKSVSVEETFTYDIHSLVEVNNALETLYRRLNIRLTRQEMPEIKNQFVKVKFSDFSQTTAEKSSQQLKLAIFSELLQSLLSKSEKPIRLLGIGVHFREHEEAEETQGLLF